MLLGLDLGTGSVKALLLSLEGRVLGEGSAPYKVRAPRSGWAESDPEEWWSATIRAAGTAIGDHGEEVRAVGLSGQMHGVVLSGSDGRPLRDAILWADTRSTEQLAAYHGLDADLRRRLANPIAAGMAGPSLMWMRDHEPETYAAARWALQPKDWVRLRLTGVAAAEPSDASATLLYDLQSDEWAFDAVEALGLRAELFATLVPSASVAGFVSREAAGAFGIGAGIPVAAGAADTAAAMLGSGLLRPGDAQLTVGTGGQIVVSRDRPDPDPRGRTHLYRTATAEGAGRWYAMAAIQNAGLALEWARGVLGASWEEVYEEAFAVPPGAEGAGFLPYLSGERTPHFDPTARGAWTGLGLVHTRGHLLRAALEGVAFALREGLEALEGAGISVPELRLAGGGTSDEPWRQLLADVLRRPLRPLPENVGPGASARGAAILAGLAAGLFSAEAAATPEGELGEAVRPGEASGEYEAAYARYREIYPRLHEPRQEV